jgi:hypothetical protein
VRDHDHAAPEPETIAAVRAAERHRRAKAWIAEMRAVIAAARPRTPDCTEEET